jgi:caffeoyl-CoA O-methyltransferase
MSKHLPIEGALYDYVLAQRTRAGEPILQELRRETEALGAISTMLVTAEQGDFLTLLVGALGVKQALEVGTFTGYSSTCIARALPADGRLLCCDVSEEWTAIARKTWKRAGVDGKIELKLGAAADTLAALPASRIFDFAFIDADKPGYDRYYELTLPHVRTGGLIVFDNMLSHGGVVAPKDERQISIDALNRKLAKDPRVEAVLLPVADGLMFCRKV